MDDLDQPWIDEISSNIANLLADEEICAHPENLSLREAAYKGHFLSYKKMLKDDYLNSLKNSGEFTEIVGDWLETLPNDSRAMIQAEFKKASDYFLTDKMTELYLEEDLEKPLWKAIGISQRTLEQLYQLGFDLIQKDQPDKAREVFKFLTFLDPSMIEFWLGLGISFFNAEKVVEAKTIFEIASILNPEHEKILFYLILCEAELKNIEKAKEYFEKLKVASKKDVSLVNDANNFILSKESLCHQP